MAERFFTVGKRRKSLIVLAFCATLGQCRLPTATVPTQCQRWANNAMLSGSEYHHSPNLCLFYCMTSCFQDARLLKIRHWKCAKAKSILYISSIYCKDPNFHVFRSTTACSDLRLTFETFTVKVPHIHKVGVPEAQI